MQYSTVQCNIEHLCTLQYGRVQYSEVLYTAVDNRGSCGDGCSAVVGTVAVQCGGRDGCWAAGRVI